MIGQLGSFDQVTVLPALPDPPFMSALLSGPEWRRQIAKWRKLPIANGMSQRQLPGRRTTRAYDGIVELSRHSPKLRIDFPDAGRLVRSMNTTKENALAVALLLEAGRIMEDISPVFTLAMRKASDITDRIERLEQTAGDLRTLAGAARALLRQRS